MDGRHGLITIVMRKAVKERGAAWSSCLARGWVERFPGLPQFGLNTARGTVI